MSNKKQSLEFELEAKRDDIKALAAGIDVILSLSCHLSQTCDKLRLAGGSPALDEYAVMTEATEAAGGLLQLRKALEVEAEDLEREINEAQD